VEQLSCANRPMFNNLKVHFAGCEQMEHICMARDAGVQYFLFSCFPFIARQFGINGFPIVVRDSFPPKEVQAAGKHVIMDSGLFTLMFGAHAAPRDAKFVYAWQQALVEFVKSNNIAATCVEVDCQKILGVREAWALRETLRRDLPNRQINVFHAEDGKAGLDSLIDFSDYIAISVPELRLRHGKNYAQHVHRLANYIKDRKPGIDIHLLGCTEANLLRKCSFCSTSDSTSWLSCVRWGRILGKHVSQLDPALLQRAKSPVEMMIEKYSIPSSPARVRANILNYASAYIHKQHYAQHAGNQE